MAYRPSKRMKKTLLGGGAVVLLAGLNAPAALSFAQDRYHAYKIDQPEYKAEYGSWERVNIRRSTAPTPSTRRCCTPARS